MLVADVTFHMRIAFRNIMHPRNSQAQILGIFGQLGILIYDWDFLDILCSFLAQFGLVWFGWVFGLVTGFPA